MPFAHLARLFGAATCLFVMSAGADGNAQSTSDALAHRSAEDGGPRRWRVTAEILQVHAANSTDAEIIGDLREGAIPRKSGVH